MSNFQRALEVILKEEGGFVDDPDDPGGATNFGITQATYGALPIEHITILEVEDIYKARYWFAGSCGKITSYPLALIHFDGCVNIGVKRAGKLLQRAVNSFGGPPNLVVDGVIGPKTLKHIRRDFGDHYQITNEELFMQIWASRISYYRKISDKNKKLRKFLRNWIVRMEHIKEEAGL